MTVTVRGLLLAIVLSIACSAKKQPPPPPPEPAPPVAVADAAAAPSAAAEVRVDRRVELLSILQRLGGGDEYRQAPATPYVAAVDRTFGPFKTHPAVRATAELRAKHGISFDAPMLIAVHLDDRLAPRNVEELPRLDARFTGVDVAAYAALVRAFAEASAFDAFFAAQRPYHEAVEAKLRAVVDAAAPIAFFDNLFGPRPHARHVVVPAPLAGPANFGPRATLPDGSEELYQLLGIPERDGLPSADDSTVALLVHEMAHSYINPLFERHAAALEKAGEALFPLVEAAMRAQAYTNWRTMLNESGVRAVVVLYMREKRGDVAGAAAARNELRASFLWTNELVEVFRKYRRDRARYPDLDAYMPQVAAFFDDLVAQYGGKPPRMPFLGPFDAVLRHDYALALPADGPLARYAAGLPFFAKRPRVPPTEAALAQATDRGLVAYGTPKTNALIALVADWARWSIAPDGIALGDKRFPGKDLVLIACWFRRDDPARGVAVYAAADERNLVGINHGLRHGMNDWLVARKTAKGYEVVARGNWPYESGAWVPFFEPPAK